MRFLFYFLILFIGVFSPFFLVCLDRGLSILFTLLRNQLVVLLIFKYIFKFSILFTSSLIFIISFLLLTSGFVCSSLSNSFRWNNFRSYQIFLVLFFFFFLRKACMNFPLRTAFAASHRLYVCIFIVIYLRVFLNLIFYFIVDFFFFFFCRMLFSLHVIIFSHFFSMVDSGFMPFWS